MGVSTVTISVEEFEDLIENKKKLEAIKEVMDNNERNNLREASKKIILLLLQDKFTEAQKIKEDADDKNVDTLIAIAEILNTNNIKIGEIKEERIKLYE